MERKTIDKALGELTSYLEKRHGKGVEVFLFGSVARGDYDGESDIDVLVLIPGEVDNGIEEEIFRKAFVIELEFNVIFGIIVHSKDFWGLETVEPMPFHQEIVKDGIKI